jgi:hypothetical protein
MLFWKKRGHPRPPAARPAPPEPVAPPPPAPTLWERIVFWRAELRREAEAAPSVDERQRIDEEEQAYRARTGQDRIAKAIAARGAWFPGD